MMDRWVIGCLGLALSSASCRSATHEEREATEVALADVPPQVRDTALRAVPGLVIEKAETESEHGAKVYVLEGEANGVAYEIEVGADGTLHEVEREHEHAGKGDDEADDEVEDEDDD